jgi:excisionase family DNA binding protein
MPVLESASVKMQYSSENALKSRPHASTLKLAHRSLMYVQEDTGRLLTRLIDRIDSGLRGGHMSNDMYLSTGEAAKVLGISRSTVARRFDEGSLGGKAHPITGERLISPESIEHFIEKHIRTAGTVTRSGRHIVLRSIDRELIAWLETIVAEDPRIKMDCVSRGSDALIACARQPADLLILDDTSTDIACPDIIFSLRNLEARHGMIVLCCLRESLPSQAALWDADDVFPVADITPDSLRSRIYDLLRLDNKGSNAPAGILENKRQWVRHILATPGTIGVYRIKTPETIVWGSVTVDNISLGGVGLSQLELNTAPLLSDSARVVLRVDTPVLPNWQSHCQIVRLHSNGGVSAGALFTSMTWECRDKILSFDQAHAAH